MFHSRSTRLALALAVACCTLAALASVGVGEARAGNCAAMNFTFTLGSTNLCNAITSLSVTSAATGLGVVNDSPGAIGIAGEVTAATGAGNGVYGFTTSNGGGTHGVEGDLLSSTPGPTSAGVFGRSESPNANGPGVWGAHGVLAGGSGSAPGVLGTTNSVVANAAGVSGQITSHADYSGGVRGENFDALCCGFGVVGFHAGQGIGIGGYAPNGFGVFGWSPNNWAGYFDGAVSVVHDLHVHGTLFKAGGAFRIDNPLEPAHSYLQHSFVESPDMKNIYDGNITTNGKGYATVTLPKWFQALNKDFRYQLTVLGKPGQFVQAMVVKEIANNRFTLETSKPNTKVSWQVTGIRHDPYANAHRIQTIAPKRGADAGKYEYPQLYGQPASKSVTALPAGLRYSKQAAMAPKPKTK